jgi:hypothetical protein
MGKEPQRIPPLRTAENGGKSVMKFKPISQRPLLRRNTSVSSLDFDSTPDDHHDDFDDQRKLPTKHQSSRKDERYTASYQVFRLRESKRDESRCDLRY